MTAAPATIRIHEVEAADDDFHAMKDARAKIYRHQIWKAPQCPADRLGLVWHIPAPLHVEPMRDACRVFVGEQDFASSACSATDDSSPAVPRALRCLALSAGGR
jgi:tRNA pseudouridine38-40 synthase